MFDFDRFLKAHFRRPQEVTALLRAYRARHIPKDEAVRKWFARETVPADWFAVLLAYMELDDGAPVRLAPYLTGGPSCGQ